MAQTFVRKTAEVQIGEKKIVLTPLTLAELQQLQELNGQIDKLGWIQYVQESAKIITASARRANPEMTDSELSTTLDLDSWQVVWNELLALSGLRVPAAGESRPAAEASTGASSTPASSTAPADGESAT